LYTTQQLSSASGVAKTSLDPVKAMSGIPEGSFDTAAFYSSIVNTNCEAVIGYIPLPVGIVGPLMLDERQFRVPMATTEGALLASTNRGCTAIRKAGGATSVVLGDGITRAPLVRTASLKASSELKSWVENPANFSKIASSFNSTSRFAKLKSVTCATAGRNVYIRFKAFSGDAMGMNMITKGVNEALSLIRQNFPDMKVMALSGNLCTDKKPSAINWIDGRGKSVAAEVRLSGHVIRTVLKTSARAMVDLNTSKNLVGSALAGSIGGFNAHASNIVTAVFLATGQDAAQNVESSTCMTLLEMDDSIRDVADPDGKEGPGVVMTVTMPSVEVGTVGGGTSLPAQAACLELLGLRGSSTERAGANSEMLARVVAGTVLAGELSLISALTTNDLLNSHLKLNRKATPPPHSSSSGAAGGASSSSSNHHHQSAGSRASSTHSHASDHAMLITPTIEAKLEELRVREAVTSSQNKHHYAGGFTTTYHSAAEASGIVHTNHHHRDSHSSTSGYHAASATPSASMAHSYTAGHAAQPIQLVAGGAPHGAHPHPLHLPGHGGGSSSQHSFYAASSPGRRFFAAPTSHSHTTRFTPSSHTAASSVTLRGIASPSEPSGSAAVSEDLEPRLSVP
jgi:hydroxymethylglutaryl-CoA reductase (NADPH)